MPTNQRGSEVGLVVARERAGLVGCLGVRVEQVLLVVVVRGDVALLASVWGRWCAQSWR